MEQKTWGWREALENETDLKEYEGYHKSTGSKYLVRSNSAPYSNSKYPTHMVVVDARTQCRLIVQLISVINWMRLAKMSERSYEVLTKNFRAIPEIARDELRDKVREKFRNSGR